MASGSINLNRTSGSSYLSFWVDWASVSRGSAANISDVHVLVYVYKSTSSTAKTYGSANTSVNLNGETKYNNGLSFSVNPGATVLLFDGWFVVQHNDDGSITVPISVTVGGNVMGASGSGYATLDKISRAATLVSVPAEFTDEDSPTITFSNPAGNAVDKLEVCISSDGYYVEVPYENHEITDKTDTSYTFTLTQSEKDALYNVTLNGSTTRTVFFYIKTTIGGLGYTDQRSSTFRVADCMPSINPAAADIGNVSSGLTGLDSDKIIKGYNYIEAYVNATAYKNASIVKQSITCGNRIVEEGSAHFGNVTSGTFIFSATDNRGQTITQTITKELIDYVKVTCGMNVSPPDADGDLEFDIVGNYFNGSFGAVQNELKLEWRYKVNDEDYPVDENGAYVWTAVTPELTGNTYKTIISMHGLDYQSYYTFQARVADKAYYDYIETGEYKVKTTPVFDWSETDFNFNVPVHVKGAITNDIPIDSYDADTLLKSGRYYLANGSINRPVDENGWLDVQSGGDGGYCYQRYVTYLGKKYERWRNAGVWGEWKLIRLFYGGELISAGTLYTSTAHTFVTYDANVQVSASDILTKANSSLDTIENYVDNVLVYDSGTLKVNTQGVVGIVTVDFVVGGLASNGCHSLWFRNGNKNELPANVTMGMIYGGPMGSLSTNNYSGTSAKFQYYVAQEDAGTSFYINPMFAPYGGSFSPLSGGIGCGLYVQVFAKRTV